jgi:hypothetical protein
VRDLRTGRATWVAAGLVGWAGVAWLGVTLWSQQPPRAGFDLALLLEAGRRVLSGQSPYAPEMLGGASPASTGLFYSYPPPVAQAMSLLTWLPDGVAVLVWGIGATVGFAIAAGLMGRALGRPGAAVAMRSVAVAPLFLPFVVAVLFGNLDAWYPLAYGALVLAVLPRPSSRTLIAAGVAVGIVSVAKLHPGLLLLWIGARAVRERGGPHARVLAAAVVTGGAIVLASLVIGGIGPWVDYATVVRVGAGADVVDHRNLAPVSLVGQLVPAIAPDLRLVQAVIAACAAITSIVAAVRVRDPLASVAIAAAASLVALPVTWFHYPAALVPVGLALAIRAPSSRPYVVVGIVLADLAISIGPLLWVAVAVLLVAALRAGQGAGPAGAPVPAAAPETAPRVPRDA